MAPVRHMRNILMELRKTCQHPYLSAPELENEDAPEDEQQKQLTEGSGKLAFLKLLLPKLKERGHRVLLFSQFKIALDRIEDFLYGEGYKFLRLDGDVQQAKRQKAMDAYNAPDSEYFIFLLTTRAGGVGINLASADTVIIYDPDFNPHMDLQAISRSHRYGQTKRVMVFKLMTKNSVEEQIMLNGKKKMVLDHLVVQQMGKENEEGDIDDLLLRGAAALYEANEDGVAASDIRYSSKDVDELIDKVEADAEAEAKAMEEREKENEEAKAKGQLENGEKEGEQSKSKETMSFGFAKIWESKGNRLEEVGDDGEERPEDLSHAWQVVMDNALKAKEAERLAMMENGRMKRNKNGYVRYGFDGGELSDESPQKQKRKYTKRKKAIPGESSEDAAFTLDHESDDSSDTGSLHSIPDDGPGELQDTFGRTTIRGLAAGKKKLTKKQLRALAAARDAENAKALAQNGEASGSGAVQMGQDGAVLAGPSGSITQDPSTMAPGSLPNGTEGQDAGKTKKKGDETPEERAARKAKRKAEKEAIRQDRYQQMLAAQRHTSQNGFRGATVPGPSQLDRSMSNPGQPSLNQSIPIPNNLDPRTIRSGQQVCQYLYHVLREFIMQSALQAWALMALPELATSERERIYKQLSKDCDTELYKRGQNTYFLQPDQLNVVIPLLRGGYPILPDQDPTDAILPLNSTMGRYNSEHQTQMAYGQRRVSPPQQRYYDPHVPSPYQSPQPSHAQLPPAAAGPTLKPTSHETTSGQLNVQPDRTSPQKALPNILPSVGPRRTPPIPPAGAATIDGNAQVVPESARLAAPSQVVCPYCSGSHKLSRCNDIPSRNLLLSLRDKIANGGDTPENKQQGLNEVAKLLQLHDTHRSSVPSSSTATLTNNAPQIPRIASTKRKSVPGPGTKTDAIVIDSDEEGSSEEMASKRSRPSVPSPGAGAGRGRPRNWHGCTICRSNSAHPAKDCPVVDEGPESIKAAMRQFEPSDAMWTVLRRLYEERAAPELQRSTPTDPCLYCQEPCGLTIKECADRRGGRKGLKDLIRGLEMKRTEGDGSAGLAERISRLYGVYLKWPKTAPAQS